MVEKIRLSLGTAIELGLEEGKRDPNFTTIFLMIHQEGRCESNCAFCPQARESTSASDRLSRISWPEYDIDSLFESWTLPGQFRRICIQTICYENVVLDVLDIIKRIRAISKLPISVAIHPISEDEMIKLEQAGVSNLGIALDACTPSLFEEIKGVSRNAAYQWDTHFNALKTALQIFGKNRVTTHLIIGLGETEKEAVDFIFRMYGMGINVGLFAFTSIRGTYLEDHPQPNLGSYRRIQVIRYLVANNRLQEGLVTYNKQRHVVIDMDSNNLRNELSSGVAFQVCGCKGCNRPYYNERPRGPMYNYPRPLGKDEILKAIDETGLV